MDWSESLRTGIELLDSQHRSLIECAAELRQTAGRGLLRSAHVMDALRMYVAVHFNTEEELMRLHDYPRLDEHIAEHRAFAARLDALMNDNIRHDNTARLVAFLDDWLENHLRCMDMDYVPYLKEPESDA